MGKNYPTTVDEALDGYVPTGLAAEQWETIEAYVGRSIREATTRPNMACKLRVVTVRHVAWCHFDQGLPLQHDAVWIPDTVERSIELGMEDLTVKSRNDYASRLRMVCRQLMPHHQPVLASGTRFDAARMSDPYSAATVHAFLQLAASQRTVYRRTRLTACLALGLGAGLDGRENHLVFSEHIEQLGDGRIRVHVAAGRQPRVVAVLPAYADRLRWVVSNHPDPDAPLVGRTRGDMSRLVRSIEGGADLPLLQAGRLRATWMATLARLALPLAALLQMAGTSTLRSFEDVTVLGDPVDIEQLEVLLASDARASV